MEFTCAIFSLDSDIVAHYSFDKGRLPITKNKTLTLDEKMVIIDKCRVLLYNTYVLEQNWQVPMDNNTCFSYKKSIILPLFPNMLCDRYDNKHYWISILSKEEEVIACCRLLIADHDIFNYNIPSNICGALQFSSYLTPAAEAQRTAISPKYRRFSLFLYLYYFSCSFAYEHLNYKTVFTTQSVDYMISLSKSVGLKTESGWQFKYSSTDEISTILYTDPKETLNIIKKRLSSKL